MDEMMETLGGERMHPFGEGDELGGQQESFFKWAKGVFAVRTVNSEFKSCLLVYVLRMF